MTRKLKAPRSVVGLVTALNAQGRIFIAAAFPHGLIAEEQKPMDVILDRVCGMDAHRDTVKVRVRVPGTKQKRESHIATFGTMTEDLLALRNCLQGSGA